ncbi:MAG TPA: hypothetical protein VKQ32_12930 [Polyangia bacterium]|nr:hypothetical protein [Polyangia bacterium]
MDDALQIPSFQEWVTYCFTDPVPKIPWEDDPPPETMVRYLVQLFEAPRVATAGLSDERIGKGLWHICGYDGYLKSARDDDVPHDLQIRCIESLKVLYRDLFAVRCGPLLQHLLTPDDPVKGTALDTICYMLFDLSQIEGATTTIGEEHLVDPIFDVLEYALGLDSVACQESALHGLGHLWLFHSKRVPPIVDRYLAAHPDLDERLRSYAGAARVGVVR